MVALPILRSICHSRFVARRRRAGGPARWRYSTRRCSSCLPPPRQPRSLVQQFSRSAHRKTAAPSTRSVTTDTQLTTTSSARSRGFSGTQGSGRRTCPAQLDADVCRFVIRAAQGQAFELDGIRSHIIDVGREKPRPGTRRGVAVANPPTGKRALLPAPRSYWFTRLSFAATTMESRCPGCCRDLRLDLVKRRPLVRARTEFWTEWAAVSRPRYTGCHGSALCETVARGGIHEHGRCT